MRSAIHLLVMLALGSSTVGTRTTWATVPDRAPTADSALLADFVSEDWGKVEQAEVRMESGEAAYIPALLSILDRDDVVPLTNTADLIYPGAKTFYGHGYIVDYDLDRIAVRAGWALEETAFEDFGFREGAIRESDLLRATVRGKSDVPLKDVVPAPREAESRKERVREARARARAWWAAEGKGWSRFTALKAALTSDDASRQQRALNWLQNGQTQCEGLDPETFARDLLPCVKRLATSDDESVREHAKALAADREGWWWKFKTGTWRTWERR